MGGVVGDEDSRGAARGIIPPRELGLRVASPVLDASSFATVGIVVATGQGAGWVALERRCVRRHDGFDVWEVVMILMDRSWWVQSKSTSEGHEAAEFKDTLVHVV